MKRRAALLALSSLPFATARSSTPDRPFRVAVIGHTGRGNFGHGLDTMWLEVPGVEWVAVSDGDPAGLSQLAQTRPSIAAYANYDTMLEREQPDIVAVAPRHADQHHAMCLAAAAAGASGIYVEKPFCRTPAEADDLKAACHHYDVKLAVAHRNRYHPALPKLKQELANGLIGEWLEIRARGKEDHRSGALDLWVLGSHVLNIACFLGGNASEAQAQFFQGERLCTPSDLFEGDEGLGWMLGNTVHARWTLAEGRPLFFDSAPSSQKRTSGFGLQCIGTEGVVDLRMDTDPLIHVRLGSPHNPKLGSQPWQPFTTAGLGQPELIANLHSQLSSHRRPALDLLASIQENRSPLCDVNEAAETIEMIHAAFASHAAGGASVPLPLSHRGHGLRAG